MRVTSPVLIEGVGRRALLRVVQAQIPPILTHYRYVLLLDKAIIIFLKRSAARELHSADLVLPVAHQMVIEELAAIIGMQFLHWERQARQDALKAAFHGLLASSEHRSALTPARGHIDELDGMTMPPRCTFAAVIDQVHLEVSWFANIPGNATHRHPFGGGIGALGSFLGQAPHLRAMLAQHACHRRAADPG